MTDQHLSELLERAADRVAVGPAPTAVMVHDAGRARRRRALTLSLASAGTVAVVAGGTALLSAPGSTPSPQPPVTSPTPITPATDQRLVGVGHAAIAVPQRWGTNDTGCGTPQKDTVVIDVGVVPLCGMPRPPGVESVEVTHGQPRFGFTADQSLTVDGVAAQRQATTCEPGFLSNTRVCSGTVYLPSMNVSFRAESSSGAADVDRILEGIQVVPDQVGVPGYQSIALNRQENSGEEYLEALRDADLAAEVQTRQVAGLDAGHVLGVSPQPGEMVAPGSVVTVTVAAEPVGAATPSHLASNAWACDAKQQTGFATDPVVYPVEVPLIEIAAQVPDAESFEIEREGHVATVTYRNADGLVVHRFEYSRGDETGWQLERGNTCSW